MLKARGIRPAGVMEAPGFFNHLFGKGKRWLAIGALSLVVVVLVVMTCSLRSEVSAARQEESAPSPRHQIYGDPALFAKLEREGYATVFPDAGCCMLAHFARPGVIVAFPDPAWRQKMAEALNVTRRIKVEVRPDDAREVQELKRIVLGMVQELDDYLSDGIGTPALYVRRLEERQRAELRIVEMAKRDLEKSTDEGAWENKNDQLRALGLPTLTMPN